MAFHLQSFTSFQGLLALHKEVKLQFDVILQRHACSDICSICLPEVVWEWFAFTFFVTTGKK